MSPKLYFVGDLHLGRRPGRLPRVVEEHGCSPAELGPAAAWRATWEQAVRDRADALVLAGDVVESIEDRIEAFSHLERGVRALTEAGVRVFGVAGNHDGLVLPALADRLPDFTLLGRGGRWQVVQLQGRDGAPFRLIGWSFPQQHVTANPLDGFPAQVEGEGPLLGVLHADVDGGSSPYAPVPRAALEAAPVDAWFLGHVHAPDPLAGPRPVGYLGSLVGLDPGEPGLHGPWRVSFDGAGGVQPEQLALAPLRWEQRELPLPELAAAEDAVDALSEHLFRAFEDLHGELRPGLGATRAVGCRFTLTGETGHHRQVAEFARAERVRDFSREFDGVRYFVDKLVDGSRPAVDLERLAEGRDPVALLARRLLVLERGGEEADALVAEATERLGAIGDRALPWGGLEREQRQVDVHAHLLRAGRRALDELIAQRASREQTPNTAPAAAEEVTR
jgi:exonuclease SbcD